MTTQQVLIIDGNGDAPDPSQALVPAAPIPAPADHPALRYLAHLDAKTSRPTMAYALTHLAHLCGYPSYEACPWQLLRFAHVDALRSRLLASETAESAAATEPAKNPPGRPRTQASRLAPATAQKHMQALRGVLKYAWKLGHLTYDEYQRAVDVAPIKGGDRSGGVAGRSISQDELHALLRVAAADKAPDGARDVAIFALGYGLGLRRSDLAALDACDVALGTADLTVRGKGNVTARLPLSPDLCAVLETWLAVRGPQAGPLFYRVRREGVVVQTRLTTQGFYSIVRRRAGEAGVAPLTPHDLRRTFAGDMLDLGVDLVTVQTLLRHADPRTTAQYDRRGERVRRAAVAKLRVPLPAGRRSGEGR